MKISIGVRNRTFVNFISNFALLFFHPQETKIESVFSILRLRRKSTAGEEVIGQVALIWMKRFDNYRPGNKYWL